jgi:acyl-CoA reductase-like NAD-dependent aldehyde dehydrogenase
VSLIDKVTPSMDCYRDEIFGPVLTGHAGKTYDEAVASSTTTRTGNGTAIFTRDGGAARQFQFEVNAGMVGVNRADPGAGRRTTASAAGRTASSATCTCTARGRQFYTASEDRDLALAGSGHEQDRPRLPAHALIAHAPERVA